MNFEGGGVFSELRWCFKVVFGWSRMAKAMLVMHNL